MKVAIITLFGYFNYGNRLQNLAMQEILKELGCVVETLKFFPANISKNISELEKLRRKEIKKWSLENIKERYIPINEKEKIINDYDYFCVGSDQIFNPKAKLIFKLNFLNFIPKGKKFTFAASFGRGLIKKDIIHLYAKGLNKFDYKRISIREKQGITLIKKIINKDCCIHLDPTLIFSWDKFINKSKLNINGKYILTYFLGKIPKIYVDIIKNIAKKNNFKLIDLNNIKNKKYYTINPSDFLFLIDNAELIFTNSFHGAAFSIKNKKPFLFLETRPKMKSRLDTLFSITNLQNRKFENIKLINNLFDIDYTGIDKLLNDERNKAFKYLCWNMGKRWLNGYRHSNVML